MITNDPIPVDATILTVRRSQWMGRACLITRYLDAAEQLWQRMEWVDELTTRPDSLAHYLAQPVNLERTTV